MFAAGKAGRREDAGQKEAAVMQKVMGFDRAEETGGLLCHREAEKLLKTELWQRCAAAYESYEQFTLCSFDWYDVKSAGAETGRVVLYLDAENLLVLCRDERTRSKMAAMLPEEEPDNGKALRRLLAALLDGDLEYLDAYEDAVTEAEDSALTDGRENYLRKIVEYRRELLRLKRYYTQLQSIVEGLLDNENGLLSQAALGRMGILRNRVDRCHAAVLNLRDYVTQMREAYQAQIDIEQNALMKIFTVITAIFLPLSLMVGWYGMNFDWMPELRSKWGYPVFILVSAAVCLVLIRFFKKKKWF